MSKNVVEPERPQLQYGEALLSNATLAQAHACTRAPTTIDTHAHTQKYVILIVFP